MKVQCSKCKQNYNIKDEKIPDAGAKIKCPKCQNIIDVMKPEPELPEWVSEDLTDDFGNESQSVQKGISKIDQAESNTNKKFKMKTSSGNNTDQDPLILNYRCQPEMEGRFVRLLAENLGICPDWHKGAGGKAWLFIDEITINKEQ